MKGTIAGARKDGIAEANKQKKAIKEKVLRDKAFDEAYGQRLLEIEEEIRNETGFTGIIRV